MPPAGPPGLEHLLFGRRLARPGQGRLPVVVLTGFLGAGKSTLIKAFLNSDAGRGTALIVNEFGEIGIDDALLRASSNRTVLLGNGCVCCSSRSDLQQTLRDLFAERAAGTIPNFQRVLIETTGLADPSPLLQTLASDRMLGLHYTLAALVSVVDAATAIETADIAPEWAKQVALADRVILTKTDLVEDERCDRVIAQVAALNPNANLVRAEKGKVDPSALTGTYSQPISRMRGEAVPAVTDHLASYQTFSITFDEPLPWPAFRAAMRALTDLRGPDLLRVKGYVNVAGREGPVVVHFVQHLEHPPEELLSWPDEDRRTRLVFITRGLDQVRVSALLQSVVSMAGGPMTPTRRDAPLLEVS